MIKITEEQISILAPNATAVSNGKKISQKNGFVKLYQSADETYIGGECSGSGKSNYITSADFINENAPVFRCSCPSRQFPCKHSIGLLYDYLAGKTFTECEIPEDILSKREKQAERKEKKEKQETKPKKVNKAAAAKKMKKQLEGLDILDKFIEGVTSQGLASLAGNALKTYEDLAKQMGDYYLPGPQVLMRELFLLVEESNQKQPADIKEKSEREKERLEEMLAVLLKLRAVSKKGREFLSNKLLQDSILPEDSIIYESLGTVWQLSQLEELGLKKEDVRLIQVSFFVDYNRAKKEYIDRGYWVDLESGVISKTENLRPLKAVKHIKQDDTVFDIIKTPALYYYPGESNKRIRYEEFETESVVQKDIDTLRSLAKEMLPEQLKRVKNQIKNVLSEQSVVALIPYDRFGKIEDNYVLIQGSQNVCLKSKIEIDTVEEMLYMLPEEELTGQVMVGEYYYDRRIKQICVMPHAIITKNAVVRLLY